MVSQSFSFEAMEDLVAWQFNREFYCIVDHDAEVSCVGLLFYTNEDVVALTMREENARRFELLAEVFADEFGTKDRVQGEILRSLLKRSIILVTRLRREQRLKPGQSEDDIDLVRKFNLLVENHYKEHHRVKDYANLLNHSPKTLASLFVRSQERTPLEVIHHRLALEARRMLLFTDSSVQEIAFAVGFEDAAHFSKFFKQQAGMAPVEFRRAKVLA